MFKGRKSELYYLSNLSTDYSQCRDPAAVIIEILVVPKHAGYISTHVRYISAYATHPAMTAPHFLFNLSFSPLLTLLQPHMLFCCSSHTSGALWPQDLCNGCSICLEHYSMSFKYLLKSHIFSEAGAVLSRMQNICPHPPMFSSLLCSIFSLQGPSTYLGYLR